MATVRELLERNVNWTGKTVPLLGTNPPVRFDGYTSSTKKIDHSGDFWVVDRDTGEVYKKKMATRDEALRWCRRNSLTCLSVDEQEFVSRADPLCATYFRKHSDLVLVSKYDL
jgi:hypothetical protein